MRPCGVRYAASAACPARRLLTSCVSSPCSHSVASGPRTSSRASRVLRSVHTASSCSARYSLSKAGDIPGCYPERMRVVHRYCTCLLLMLGVLVGAGPATAQPAGEDTWGATFRILIQGRNVGSEQVSVLRDGSGLTLRSSGGLAGGGFVLRSAEVVYDPAGAPRRLRVEARVKQQPLL